MKPSTKKEIKAWEAKIDAARAERERNKTLCSIRALAESLGIDQAGIDIRDICNSELGE